MKLASRSCHPPPGRVTCRRLRWDCWRASLCPCRTTATLRAGRRGPTGCSLPSRAQCGPRVWALSPPGAPWENFPSSTPSWPRPGGSRWRVSLSGRTSCIRWSSNGSRELPPLRTTSPCTTSLVVPCSTQFVRLHWRRCCGWWWRDQ